MTRQNGVIRLCLAIVSTALISACTLIDNAEDLNTSIIEGVPVVQLASPLPNETYAVGASVNILGRVENAGEDVAMIDILLNGASIGSAPDPNESGASAFTITNSWLAVPGDHIITLRALRADGTLGEASVSISVQGSEVVQVPTVEVTAEAEVQPQLPTPVVPAQTQPTAAPTTIPATQVLTVPTNTPAQSAPAQPQQPAASSTTPTITVISGANIRSGPSLAFAPPLGSLLAGATGTIVAISPDRQWYRITYNNGNGRGWINAATVTTSGDLSGLPVDPGPAAPPPTAVVPVAPTAADVAATAAPAANTDLSITFLATTPDPLVCNEVATISVIVVNTGSTPSAETTVLVQDLYNGNAGATATANVRALGQNESVELAIPLNVSTNFLEPHTLRVRVDPNNIVPETNEGNNEISKNYTLAQGGC